MGHLFEINFNERPCHVRFLSLVFTHGQTIFDRDPFLLFPLFFHPNPAESEFDNPSRKPLEPPPRVGLILIWVWMTIHLPKIGVVGFCHEAGFIPVLSFTMLSSPSLFSLSPFSLFTDRQSTVAFLVSLLLSSNILFTYSPSAHCLLSYVLYKCVSSKNNGTVLVVRLRIYPCVYAVCSMCFICFCKWCPGCTSRPDPRTRLKEPRARLYRLS